MKKQIISVVLSSVIGITSVAMPYNAYADPEEDYLPLMYLSVEENDKVNVLSDGTVYIDKQNLTGDDSIRINVYIRDESKSCWNIAPKIKCEDQNIKFNESAVKNETLAYGSRHEFLSSIDTNYNTVNMTLKTPLLEIGTKLEVTSENTDDYPIAHFNADINSEIPAGEYKIYFLTEPEDQPEQRFTQISYRYDDGNSETFIPETQDLKIIVSGGNVLGDVNGDGQINAVDASCISLEYSLLSTNKEGTFTDEQKKVADINGDGMFDAVDASIICSFYAYLSTGGTETDIKQWFEHPEIYTTTTTTTTETTTTTTTTTTEPLMTSYDSHGIASGDVNLRSAPTTESDIIADIPQNASIIIYGYNEKWYKVSYQTGGDTYYGYASRSYITDTANIDWQSAYMKTLESVASQYNFGTNESVNAMYDLVDINGNGIPELVISDGTAHASGCVVYTYTSNGYVKTTFSDGRTGFSEYGLMGVDTENHVARSYWYGGGYQFIDFYRLEGTNFVKIASFSNDEGNNRSDYKYNDTSVTKEQYDEYRSQYGYDYYAYGRQYIYTSATIMTTATTAIETTVTTTTESETTTTETTITTTTEPETTTTETTVTTTTESETTTTETIITTTTEPLMTSYDSHGIASGDVNLRSAPTTESDIITVIPKNASVIIYGYNEKWYKVSYQTGGTTYYGYASRSYITDTANIDWQSAYKKTLESLASEYDFTASDSLSKAMYDLVDINGNGIPELIISTGTFHAAGCYVYTYVNGGYVKTTIEGTSDGFSEWGKMGVDTENHIARSYWYGMGYEYVDFYRLEGTQFVHLASFSNDEGNNGSDYQYNGNSVTKSQYQEYRSQYGYDFSSYGREYTYTPATTVTLATPVIGSFRSRPRSSVGDGVMVYATWNSISNADGYEVEKIETEHSESYKRTFTTQNTYVETGGSVSINIKARVRAYKTVNGKKIYSEWSNTSECELDDFFKAVYNRKGQINTKGGTVAGYTTNYVVNGGAMGKVRTSLGNAWHVTAHDVYYRYGLTWFELYDSDDGDYYGWVDSRYISFY